MKMTNVVFLIAAMSFGCALGSTSVSEVLVRQQWPWRSTVNVDFTITGSEGEVAEISMGAYAGDTFLGYIPPALCKGDTVVTANGLKRITFDPSEVPFLVDAGTMANFRLDVVARSTPADEILYMIFDLRKTASEAGHVEYVTEFALTNGVWGAWERNYWGLLETPIWTGVTQDDRYKTTHLVVRRIPAGSFQYGTDASSEAYFKDDIVKTTVTISKAYYIGVFETTAGQFVLLTNRTSTATLSKSPSYYKYYSTATAAAALRGHPTSSYADYNWPTGRKVRGIMSYLRTRTGLDFDLPTEAQWEKAARGGSTGIYYSSNSESIDSTQLSKLAWCRASDPSLHQVGLKLPNAYGLYDVLGNIKEQVLDWHAPGYVPDASDPEGPLAAYDSNKYRVLKGYGYYGTVDTGNVVHLGGRETQKETSASTQTGYRVCCPSPF